MTAIFIIVAIVFYANARIDYSALPNHVYGEVLREDGSFRNRARLNMRTGRVEFVLWKAGEQGHKQDFWYEMGYGWELQFKPY